MPASIMPPACVHRAVSQYTSCCQPASIMMSACVHRAASLCPSCRQPLSFRWSQKPVSSRKVWLPVSCSPAMFQAQRYDEIRLSAKILGQKDGFCVGRQGSFASAVSIFHYSLCCVCRASLPPCGPCGGHGQRDAGLPVIPQR